MKLWIYCDYIIVFYNYENYIVSYMKLERDVESSEYLLYRLENWELMIMKYVFINW